MMKYRKEIITEEKTKCQRVTQFSGDGSVDKVSEKTETTKNEKTIEIHDNFDPSSTIFSQLLSLLQKILILLLPKIIFSFILAFLKSES